MNRLLLVTLGALFMLLSCATKSDETTGPGIGGMAANAKEPTPSSPDEGAPEIEFLDGGPDLFDEDSPFGGTEVAAKQPCSPADRSAARQHWEKFRSIYPYHHQTVAASAPSSTGCRTLIVAEPPPHVSVESMKQLAPELLATVSTEKHAIGYDGWTMDAVFTVPELSSIELADLVARIHVHLFGTSYGSYLDPVDQPPPTNYKLDIKPRPQEVHDWLVGAAASFTPVDEPGAPRPGLQLLQTGKPGVFANSTRELVVWVIPRNKDIGELRADARAFFVDSDLIVGAVASDVAVAILGRARIVDTRHLPPLRFETARILAATTSSELVQSYERGNIFAGRYENQLEWAPVVLSDELVDTEYGSLLNITDQILKGWANGGKTRYHRFDYPLPKTWPFKKDVIALLDTTQLVYNWNTKSSAGAVQLDELEVFWLRRTGALNVTFLAGDDADQSGMQSSSTAAAQARKKAEDLAEAAHNAFSNSQDPNLVRVAEYNALYQIFRNFHLNASPPPSGLTSINTMDPSVHLTEQAQVLLQRLQTVDDEEVRSHLDKFYRVLGDTSGDGEPIPASIMTRTKIDASMSEFQQLRQDLSSAGPLILANVAVALVGRPTTLSRSTWRLAMAVRAFKWRLAGLFDCAGAMKRYLAAFSEPLNRWIHTPSVVVSWNTGSLAGGSGGHNLDSKITEFHIQSSIKGVIGSGHQWALEPGSLGRLRLGARQPVLDAVAHPVRPPRLALAMPQRRASARSSKFGWSARQTLEPQADSLSTLVVARDGTSGYKVILTKDGRAFDAASMEDVLQIVERHGPANDNAVVVELQGFKADEARSVVQTLDIRGKRGFTGVVSRGGRLTDGRRLNVSKARVYRPKMKQLADGTTQLSVALEFPIDNRPSLWIRIKLFVKGLSKDAAAKLKSSLEDVLRRALGRPGGGPASINDISVELHRELKHLLPDDHNSRIDMKIRQEATDIIIIQNEAPPDRGRVAGIPV